MNYRAVSLAVISTLLLIGCEEVAKVRIVAPSELAGAAVLVDGAD